MRIKSRKCKSAILLIGILFGVDRTRAEPVSNSYLRMDSHSQAGSANLVLGGLPKKTMFFWDIFPKSVYPPTHPRVFVRFGKTKGEIWVEKGDFRGNLGGF